MIYLICQFLILAAVVLTVNKPSFVACLLVFVLSLLLGSLFYKTMFNSKKIKYFSLLILILIVPIFVAFAAGIRHFEIFVTLAGLSIFGFGALFASYLQHSEDIDFVIEEHGTLVKENVEMSNRITDLLLNKETLNAAIKEQTKQSEEFTQTKKKLEMQLSELVSQKSENELADHNKQKQIEQIEKQLDEFKNEIKIRDSNISDLNAKLNQFDCKYNELVIQFIEIQDRYQKEQTANSYIKRRLIELDESKENLVTTIESQISQSNDLLKTKSELEEQLAHLLKQQKLNVSDTGALNQIVNIENKIRVLTDHIKDSENNKLISNSKLHEVESKYAEAQNRLLESERINETLLAELKAMQPLARHGEAVRIWMVVESLLQLIIEIKTKDKCNIKTTFENINLLIKLQIIGKELASELSELRKIRNTKNIIHPDSPFYINVCEAVLISFIERSNRVKVELENIPVS